MKVIPPLRATPFAIEPAMLTSATANGISLAEPAVGETAWTSGATFGLGAQAILGAPSSAVTMTIASPGVVTWASHGLPDGTLLRLTTTGALPTGLSAGVDYYILASTANTFQLSTEADGAPIVTSGSQSGTHTATAQVHRTYESLVAGNTGHPPAIDDGTNWIDVGPTNKWAMLDLLRNTQTICASPLVVTLTPGERVDAIGAVGLVADSITFQVSSVIGGGVVYTYTQSLILRPTTSWYTYFFGRFRQAGEAARFDLPPYVDAVVTVTLTRAAGNVRCGGIVIGRQIDLGQTQFEPTADADNYSKINRDDFGTAELIPRRSVPTTSQRVRCAKTDVDKILQAKDDLNAVPALWSGLDDSADGYFGALLILGIYRRWQITLAQDAPDVAMQQLDLEEV